MGSKELLRQIPSVEEIMQQSEVVALTGKHPRPLIIRAVRQVTDDLRQKILRSADKDKSTASNLLPSDLTTLIEQEVKKQSTSSLKHVINATGVVLHTNMGRAVMAEPAKKAVAEVLKGYSNLEIDAETGKRGSRYFHVAGLLTRLTGAEAGFVVNNNASAVFLALNTLAREKEVIVSRGELIEIGGSFRMPAIMSLAGVKLVEVGTTNKTHFKDYEEAITEETGLLLKVHPSNYQIKGFTAEVSLEEMVKLGEKYDLPVMYDAGSGAFIDFASIGCPEEPSIQKAVATGVDITTFSGDKLLGGPQAGLVVGKREYIEAMEKNHLTRVVRIDKMTLAALEATLRVYLDEENPTEKVPVLQMLTASAKELETKAIQLADKLKKAVKADIQVIDTTSEAGGGSLPTLQLPSKAVAVKLPKISPAAAEKKLYESEPPIFVRIADDRLVLDVRTVLSGEDDIIVDAFKKLVKA